MQQQQPRYDLAALKDRVVLSDFLGQFLELKRAGTEWKCCSPFTNEKTPSFTVNDQKALWFDFSSGKHGDAIDFIEAYQNLPKADAIKAVARWAGLEPAGDPLTPGQAPARLPSKKKEAKEDWVPLLPVPADAPPHPAKHPAHGAPSRVWAYKGAKEEVLGFVCRFDQPDGGKEVLPLSYAVKGSKRDWRWLSFGKPRPLYGLEMLARHRDHNVVIVEGEKAADAARELFPQAVVITWPGGGKAVKHADWSALQGRKVVIWPDWDTKNFKTGPYKGQRIPWVDQPGIATAVEIAEVLTGVATAVRILNPQAVATNDGWDAADALAEGWTPDRAMDFLKSSLRTADDLCSDLSPKKEAPPPSNVPDHDHDREAPPHDDAPHGPGDRHEEPQASPLDDAPFTCLGYDHGRYYYMARGSKQVVELSGSGHTKGNLLMLAPLHWWEREFRGKEGPNWDMAANMLIRSSEQAGVYDAMRVRGRGAWWDDGAAVLHLGDKLISSGRELHLSDMETRYIYEAEAPIRISTSNPLSSKEAVALVELCNMLSWEKRISGVLLAGWCVVAPICGALKWRPHVWMTGPAGSGKSWIYENILVRTLGDMALAAASETTEAGLRQVLGNDARPVIFDEAESETTRAQARIQNVMALMRQASSETSAAIFKGTTTGEGVRYRPRSCFAFASIGVGLHQHADQTRCTVLSITAPAPHKTKDERAADFAKIELKWADTLTTEFVERLHARTISLIPVIRRNAETFAVAGASVMGTRRLGDQLGALIAGAYSLFKSTAVSLDEARSWLQKQDWSDLTVQQESKDELRCLRHICQNVLRFQTERGALDMAVSELVAIAVDHEDGQAHATLKRHGLRVDDGWLCVSNSHTGVAKILANTPWADGWERILKRIDGAGPGGLKRFSGPTERCTQIPLAAVLG